MSQPLVSDASKMTSLAVAMTGAIVLLFADSISSVLGFPILWRLTHGGMTSDQANVIYALSVVAAGVAVWGAVPLIREGIRLAAFLINRPSLGFWSMPDEHKRYLVPIRDVERQATASNNAALLGKVSERLQSVNNDRAIRALAAVLVMALVLDGCVTGSLMRNFSEFLDHAGWKAVILQLALVPLGIYLGLLALFAFFRIEEEEWMPRSA